MKPKPITWISVPAVVHRGEPFEAVEHAFLGEVAAGMVGRAAGGPGYFARTYLPGAYLGGRRFATAEEARLCVERAVKAWFKAVAA